MKKHPALNEALDFAAHAGSAFLFLVVAQTAGVWFTASGAVFLAWAYGFVREFTEWQDAGLGKKQRPWSFWAIMDQLGWVSGGLAFVWVVDL